MERNLKYGKASFEGKLPYLFSRPEDFSEKKKYPVILFLHGAGTRGSDLARLEKNGCFRDILEMAGEKCLIFAPQCAKGAWFAIMPDLVAFCEHIRALPEVDASRFYLTGNSMGGSGTWDLSYLHPEFFAATAPLCGSGRKGYSKKLTDLPIWVFHGLLDPTVPCEESILMVKAINERGGNAKFTPFETLEHDCWSTVYKMPALYEWMLSHVQGENVTRQEESEEEPIVAEHPYTVETFAGKRRYLLSRPSDFSPGCRYPVILFLHGSGERGQNTEKLEAHSTWRHLRQMAGERCILVSPLCDGVDWNENMPDLIALCEHLRALPEVDPSRFYLTGISMGGNGAWELAMLRPHFFAAVAPICGMGIGGFAKRLVGVPVWAFHGMLDPLVLCEESIRTVSVVNRSGGHARLTLYETLKHNSWDAAYTTPELYEWMLSCTKKDDAPAET